MSSFFYSFKAWIQGLTLIETVNFGESASAAENYFNKHAFEFDVAMLLEETRDANGQVVDIHLCTQPIDYTHPEIGDEPFIHIDRKNDPYEVKIYRDGKNAPILFDPQDPAWRPTDEPNSFLINVNRSPGYLISLGPDLMQFRTAEQIRGLLSSAFFTWKLSLCLDVAVNCGECAVAKVLSIEIKDRLLYLSLNEA